MRATSELTSRTAASGISTKSGLGLVRSAKVTPPPASVVQNTCSTLCVRTVTRRFPVAREKNRTLVGAAAALDAADHDVVAGTAQQHVAAQHPDQDVVAPPPSTVSALSRLWLAVGAWARR
jgi:hypothetical protein